MNSIKMSDGTFVSLITLCAMIFVIIVVSSILSKLTKGTFCCCKYKIQNIEETLPV